MKQAEREPLEVSSRLFTLFLVSVLLLAQDGTSLGALFVFSGFLGPRVFTSSPEDEESTWPPREENDQERLTTLWSRTLGSTTSVLTATALVYAAGAGITAAAGTRLAFQSILIAVFGYSIHRKLHSPDRACGVTTFRRCLANVYWHWTICAPAAYLSSGGHLSGPLSGVEPIFSVTRHSHCGPLHHNRQLIGQKFATATQNAFCVRKRSRLIFSDPPTWPYNST